MDIGSVALRGRSKMNARVRRAQCRSAGVPLTWLGGRCVGGRDGHLPHSVGSVPPLFGKAITDDVLSLRKHGMQGREAAPTLQERVKRSAGGGGEEELRPPLYSFSWTVRLEIGRKDSIWSMTGSRRLLRSTFGAAEVVEDGS
ncbi:hypothetical protein MRX96_003712 [Rhipicephalus microplus]